MSVQQIQTMRDAALARRITLALGGVPTLRLCVRAPVADVRDPASLTARERRILAECRRVNGEGVRP